MTDLKNAFMSWKPATSACFYGTLDKDKMRSYGEAGIKALELSFSREYYYDGLNLPLRHSELKAWAAEYDVGLWSIHLPFSGEYDISNPDEKMRDFTIQTNLELMEAASKAGISVAVVHPSSEPIADSDRASRMELSIAGLDILVKRAAELGMRVAVENLPRTCLLRRACEAETVLKALPGLNLVFDTNHLLLENNIDFINAVGDRIITLHVSDYDFIDERHVLPFEGKNDWKGIITALAGKGYKGPWLYEVPSRGKLQPSDLIENYKKLSELAE